jgi:asparagine synthase (glutamine-hydrolysing)
MQDSLGMRTLFYVIAGSNLTVSSDLRALLAATGATNLNQAFFAEFLSSGQKPHLQTPYSGISRLGLGETVIIQDTQTVSLRPWSPPERRFKVSFPSAVSELRSLLDEAVATMLPEKGPILSDLSGGLDSSTVLMTALRFRSDIEALTIVSSSNVTEDEKYARQLVESLGLHWHTIDIDSSPPYSLQPDEFVAEPGDEDVLPIQMARLKLFERTQTSAALTGHFGDALFGSSHGVRAFHLADPISVGQVLRAIRMARNLRDHLYTGRSWVQPLFYFGLTTAWRHWRKRSLRSFHNQPPYWLAHGFIKKWGLDKGASPQVVPRVREAGKQYLWEIAYQSARLLSSDYRTAVGADVRHPLMHRPLVEFMLGLDSELRFNACADRVLQREALCDRLPPAILNRTTKGRFQENYHRAFISSTGWISMLTDSPRLVDMGWVDGHEWAEMIARARFGVVTRRQEFDAAITTECWLRNIEKQSSPASPSMYATIEQDLVL